MAHEAVTKPYADFTWYSTEFGGSLLTASTFPRYARWATSLIDAVTYGNIKSDDQVLDCVKDATCAAAELAYNYWISSVNVKDGKAVSSETNDGYSISYSDTLLTAESLQEQCVAQIRIYLQGTGLLFRGVRIPRRKRRPPW